MSVVWKTKKAADKIYAHSLNTIPMRCSNPMHWQSIDERNWTIFAQAKHKTLTYIHKLSKKNHIINLMLYVNFMHIHRISHQHCKNPSGCFCFFVSTTDFYVTISFHFILCLLMYSLEVIYLTINSKLFFSYCE